MVWLSLSKKMWIYKINMYKKYRYNYLMVTTYNSLSLYVIYLNTYITQLYTINSFMAIDNYKLKAVNSVLTTPVP